MMNGITTQIGSRIRNFSRAFSSKALKPAFLRRELFRVGLLVEGRPETARSAAPAPSAWRLRDEHRKEIILQQRAQSDCSPWAIVKPPAKARAPDPSQPPKTGAG